MSNHVCERIEDIFDVWAEQGYGIQQEIKVLEEKIREKKEVLQQIYGTLCHHTEGKEKRSEKFWFRKIHRRGAVSSKKLLEFLGLKAEDSEVEKFRGEECVYFQLKRS